MRLTAIAAMALTSGAAHAQFLTGITKPVFGINQSEAFFVDLDAGTSTLLFDIETIWASRRRPPVSVGWRAMTRTGGSSRRCGTGRRMTSM